MRRAPRHPARVQAGSPAGRLNWASQTLINRLASLNYSKLKNLCVGGPQPAAQGPSKADIARSPRRCDKPRPMTKCFVLADTIRPASAAPAGYYYVEEVGTS